MDGGVSLWSHEYLYAGSPCGFWSDPLGEGVSIKVDILQQGTDLR